MKAAVAYTRVSTNKQKSRGLSPEDQRRQIEEFAEKNTLRIAGEFSDMHSARNEQEGSERPGFNEACKLALISPTAPIATG